MSNTSSNVPKVYTHLLWSDGNGQRKWELWEHFGGVESLEWCNFIYESMVPSSFNMDVFCFPQSLEPKDAKNFAVHRNWKATLRWALRLDLLVSWELRNVEKLILSHKSIQKLHDERWLVMQQTRACLPTPCDNKVALRWGSIQHCCRKFRQQYWGRVTGSGSKVVWSAW